MLSFQYDTKKKAVDEIITQDFIQSTFIRSFLGSREIQKKLVNILFSSCNNLDIYYR